MRRLEAAVEQLRRIDDDEAYARELNRAAAELDEDSVNYLSATHSSPGPSHEIELWRRAVSDYAQLQAQLKNVRAMLFDRRVFISILQKNGHEIESTKVALALLGAMDMALQHLVHLMQYDSPERCEVDVRNGFQLTCGSTCYGRFYFAPSKESSDD